jgi:hypothetical protein
LDRVGLWRPNRRLLAVEALLYLAYDIV